MKNIAIIGAGSWGKNLVRTFYELGRLATVCDNNEKTLQTISKNYPDTQVTTNYRDILKDKNIQGVVIASPAVTHYELAKEALLDGKHVFVEKPMALYVSQGQELIQLAETHKRILMVGHILQYHNAVIKLKELIDQGELGKIQYIYSNRLNIGKIRREENILWSFAPHDVSTILMLLNEFPVSVNTTGSCYLQPDIFDVTLTQLKFLSGVQAHIFVSWLHPFKEQKLIVIGSKKMAVFDDVSQEKLFLYPHTVEWIDRVPVASKAQMQVVPFPVEEPLKNECQHFIECIEEDKLPKTDGHDGLKVLRVLDLSEKSLRAGTVLLTGQLLPQDKYTVHESSYVDQDVVIGEGTQIWHFSHVLKGSRIGKKCNIGQNVVIGPDVTIGNNCKIQNNVSVYKGVTLEDDVFCGPAMVFTNVMNPRSAIARMKEYKKTQVKKGATIGANATIVCGITIGSYAFIGAGAIVTKDVPDYALIYGAANTIQGWMCACGVKLDFKNSQETACHECHRQYILKNKQVARKSSDTSSLKIKS